MDLHAQDITTKRLRLRLLKPTDADWIAREIANPKVHQWLTSVPRPYSLEDAVEFIGQNRTNAGYRVIEEDGAAVGVVSTTVSETFGGAPELGYWLREDAWGRGIMTEAAGALLQWHQATFATEASSGWIVGNKGSENVLRKLGFVDDELVERHSCFHDGVVNVQRVKLEAP